MFMRRPTHWIERDAMGNRVAMHRNPDPAAARVRVPRIPLGHSLTPHYDDGGAHGVAHGVTGYAGRVNHSSIR